MQLNSTEPKKVKVRFLDSIAGLADVNRQALDLRYLRIRAELETRKSRPTDSQITEYINGLRLADGYDNAKNGFRTDWSFRPGEVRRIPAELAAKWDECGGIIEILEEGSTV